MAVKPVRRMGDPVLFEVARPVAEFNTPELNELIKDMFDTMEAMDGAGIAAPQIGVSLRVIIFGVGANPRYPEAEAVPTTVLINPEIEIIDDTLESGWEGCLSVPGMRGLISRPSHIRYRGVDQYGHPIERNARGFHARVVQHETDHLDGILYPMRIEDMHNFGYEDVLFPDL